MELVFLLPNSLITHYLKCKQLSKFKINVTTTLRNAPSTRTEFRVSARVSKLVVLVPHAQPRKEFGAQCVWLDDTKCIIMHVLQPELLILIQGL